MLVIKESSTWVSWYVSVRVPSSHPASCRAPCIIPYFAFIMAVSLSSLVSVIIYSAALSRVAIISSPFGNDFTKFSMLESFSNNLIDKKRVEYLYLICSSFCISFFISSMACSIYLPWFRCTCRWRFLPFRLSPSYTLITVLKSSSTPLPFLNTVGTSGMPNSSPSLS